MTNDWKLSSLKNAGVSLIDCVHKTPPESEEGYPYIAIPQLKNGHIDFSAKPRLINNSDYEKWTVKAKPQVDDIVLSRRCNPGETAYVPKGKEFALGQNLVLLRSNNEAVFPPFLRWLVRGPEWWSQISKYLNVGAIFDSLRCGDIPKFELLLPPLSEQKAIAHILGSLDDKIELNRQMNETLEAMAQALFKSWFVDFDPVIDNALAAGHAIPDVFAERAAQRKAMNKDEAINPLFPDAFEYTEEMGWIPERWIVRQLKTFGKVITGKTPPKKVETAYDDNGTPFITPTDIDDAPFVYSTNRFLSEDGVKAVKNSVLDSGAICVTCIGSQMGKTTISPSNSVSNQQINSITGCEKPWRNFLFFELRRRKEEISFLEAAVQPCQS